MRVIWPVHNLWAWESQYIGIMSIAAVLKNYGFQSIVVPANPESVISEIKKDSVPPVLAYSTTTPLSRHYLDLNSRIKKDHPEIFSIFGGSHPTYFPEAIKEADVDAICVGEGEYPMLDLVKCLSEGSSPASIPNIWIKKTGRIEENPVRPLINDLDELPIPLRELFFLKDAHPLTQAVVITGRGCPYQCSYCFNHIHQKLYKGKGPIIRRRSVDRIIEELLILKRAGYHFIRFADDIFILSREWIEEFGEKYRKKINLPFSCLVQVNLVTPEIIRTLRKAGCYRVMMGLEAGNEQIRNHILKRKMSQESIIQSARIIRGAGIKLVTANMLGIPGGSFRTDWETLELNIKCRPHYASVSFLNPFPRTEIYEYAEAIGCMDEKRLKILETTLGFGMESPLRWKDKNEKRKTENLQKFFTVTARHPFLKPVVQRLINWPPNRFFEIIYLISTNFGQFFHTVPLRIGWPLLRKKLVKRISQRFRFWKIFHYRQ